MTKTSPLDRRDALDGIKMRGVITHRDDSHLTIHVDNLMFEIPVGDLIEAREIERGEHELRVRKDAKIVLQSLIDAAQTAYVLDGRGAVKFINTADNCTDCSACTNCGTDCSKCSDCTECCRLPVDLGTGVTSIGHRFLTPLGSRATATASRIIDRGGV